MVWVIFAGRTRGQLHEDGTLELDARLRQQERAAVLAHELVHDERGLFYDDDTPLAMIEKEESAVNATVAMRLVPWAELAELIHRAESDDWGLEEAVTAKTVAVEFDTTVEVADRALKMARQRVLCPDHPRWREWI